MSLCILGAPASTLATNRVPTHTPDAPYLSYVNNEFELKRRGVHERGSEPAPVGNSSCRDDEDWFPRERADGILAEVDDGGDEDGEGDVPGMATGFSALSTYHIDAYVRLEIAQRKRGVYLEQVLWGHAIEHSENYMGNII